MGRLDHLVETVHERYKDRYFESESMYYVVLTWIKNLIQSTEVFIDVQGDKFSARVMHAFPPKSSSEVLALNNAPSSSSPSLKRKRAPSVSDATSSLSPTPDVDSIPIHVVGGNLNISLDESISQDDPTKYFYKVQILEEEKGHKDGMLDEENEEAMPSLSNGRRESGRVKEREKEHDRPKLNGHVDTDSKAKWAGSLMEVQCNVMS